jgi:hypothetical protein
VLYYAAMMSVNALSRFCDEITDALAASDQQRLAAATRSLAAATPQAAPDDVQDAMARLARILATIRFDRGVDLVRLVGAMTDYGPLPRELLPVLVRRATEVMELAARFATIYGVDAESLPDPADPGLVQPVMTRLHDILDKPVAAPPLPGMPDLPATTDAAPALAEAWFTSNGWVRPLLYLLQRKDVRASLPERARLLAVTEAVAGQFDAAHWLRGLLLVLDDEVLVVLHRLTGRGHRVTISGIGDNFQLHTLLAANLIGDESRGMIPGPPPTPAEIAAASDGELTPPGGIKGNFNLVDAYGKWIWNEGRPVDIPRLEGTRVVVIDPPPYERMWNAGRAYPLMRPTVTVDEILPVAETARWLSMVKPLTR